MPDEKIALKNELAAAQAEILTLRMRLKNAEMMYRFAAIKELAPKTAPLKLAERN